MIARKIQSLLVVALLGLLFSSVHAEPPLAWGQLTQTEKQVLEQYAQHWDELEATQRQTLRRIARNWEEMSPEQRIAIQQRLIRWITTPEHEKQEIRENYRRFRQLAPEEQQRIQQQRQAFRKLPENERLDLKQKWMQEKSQQPLVTEDNAAEKGDANISADDKTHDQVNDKSTDNSKNMDRHVEPDMGGARPLNNNRIRPDQTMRPMRRAR